MSTVTETLAIAVQHHQAGRLPQAEQLYWQVLERKPGHPGALNLLGVIACQRGNIPEGIVLYQQSLAAKPDFAEAHYNLALALQLMGVPDEAIAHFKATLALQPQNAEAHNNLGNLLVHQGKLEEGMMHYRQALTLNPNYASAHINLGGLMAGVGRLDDAISHLQQAIRHQPNAVQAHHLLGHVLTLQGRLDDAVLCFKRALAIQPTAETHYSLGKTFEEQGRTEEAIAQFKLALQQKPAMAEALWQSQLILPVFYDHPEQISSQRQHFCRQLNQLIQQTDLSTPAGKQAALQGIGSRTNFYLAYQGLSDRGLQCKYGQLVHRVMAANFSQWVGTGGGVGEWGSRGAEEPRGGGAREKKIRVGYLSAHLMAHSAAAWARGWIKHHDRQQFEIYSYHIGQRVDFITQEFRDLSDVFRHLPGRLEAIAQQVLADQLDILVFTDIGMEPQTTQLAGLRLAPVQCTAWGHPLTSGIPTIDYYLSSALMEPANAQRHYSEHLVELPHIGICYTKPPLPETQKTRVDFGLRRDGVIYLSFQSPFKYLPQYDRVFAQIAQQVPQSQFVFLRHSSDYILERFQRRLKRTFTEVGLNSGDYCVFLPKLDRPLYWSLNLVSDVFLDTFEWSGGNSTLEAVAFGLPVVTMPGQFMRGRHSYAILQRLGVTDTIAATEADYVAIATRLGTDPDWRQTIATKMRAGHDQLYDDQTCVTALEAFYISVSH